MFLLSKNGKQEYFFLSKIRHTKTKVDCYWNALKMCGKPGWWKTGLIKSHRAATCDWDLKCLFWLCFFSFRSWPVVWFVNHVGHCYTLHMYVLDLAYPLIFSKLGYRWQHSNNGCQSIAIIKLIFCGSKPKYSIKLYHPSYNEINFQWSKRTIAVRCRAKIWLQHTCVRCGCCVQESSPENTIADVVTLS